MAMGAFAGIAGELARPIARRRLVRPKGRLEGRTGGGQEPFGNLAKSVDVVDDPLHLLRPRRQFFVGNVEAGELGDAGDAFGGQERVFRRRVHPNHSTSP